MARSHDTTTGDVTTLNGRDLYTLSDAKEALSYLNDDYNDGELHEAEGGRCLVVVSRGRHFQHFDLFQRSHHINISNVTALCEDGTARLKVELREADA